MRIISSEFPISRLRINRQEAWCRDLVAETQLSVKDFIFPLFIREHHVSQEIPAMPGVLRHTLEELVTVCKQAKSLGIRAVILFPYTDPSLKSEDGKESCN